MNAWSRRPDPGAPVRCREQGVDLVTREKADLPARVPLWRDGEHPLDLVRVGRQLEGREPEERMDGSKPQVAAADAHAARRFQVVEEINDQRRVDLFELQIRRLPPETFPRERQELAEGVPVGLDGVRARLALVYQALDEEPLEQGRKAGRPGHGRSSQRLSRRRTASRISSGEASR